MHELENVRPMKRLADTQDIYPMALDMDMQVWRNPNPHVLRARFNEAQKRGYVALVSPVTGGPRGGYRMVVKRLKSSPRVSRGVKGVLAFIVVMTTVLAVLVWQQRVLLAAASACALVVWLAVRLGQGHKPTCAGLHCAGCVR